MLSYRSVLGFGLYPSCNRGPFGVVSPGAHVAAPRERGSGTAVSTEWSQRVTPRVVLRRYAPAMSAVWRWRPLPFDVLLAVALLILGELQVRVPDPHRVIAYPVFSAVVWAVVCTAVAWRRRWPWPTFAVVVVALTVEALPAPDSGTFAGFMALCLLLYTVARLDHSLEKAVAASVIALLALVFHYSRDPFASNAVESIQATYVVLLACPFVARIVASRAARGAAMEAELAVAQLGREQATKVAVEAERARIAAELHDVIAHSVSVTIVQSMAARSAIDDRQLRDARHRVDMIEESARQALADMRRLVAINETDAPTPTHGQPRMTSLAALVERLQAGGGRVMLEQRGTWTDVPLGVDLALFRITQEALTNAINHAPGASIDVRVTRTDGFIESEVTNGPATGSDPGPGTGRGLTGMRDRVQLYGGTLSTGRQPDGGYRVRAVLPVAAADG